MCSGLRTDVAGGVVNAGRDESSEVEMYSVVVEGGKVDLPPPASRSRRDGEPKTTSTTATVPVEAPNVPLLSHSGEISEVDCCSKDVRNSRHTQLSSSSRHQGRANIR
jgi:hypothetical protein